MIKQKNTLGVAVPYPEFFGVYWYLYPDQYFSKSIAEHTIRKTDRQTDRQKFWLYLAAF